MKYQDCAEPAQEPIEADDGVIAGDFAACDANINPVTGLATDYLNHFNEAIMLLEMLSDVPDCLDDFLNWRPRGYREHFAASRFAGRAVAIAAYDAADPTRRASLDALAGTMNALLQATGAVLRSPLPPQAAAELATHTAAWLKPLVARAGAVINGEADLAASNEAQPQAAIDALLQRSSS
jgi:hypothetical protein